MHTSGQEQRQKQGGPQILLSFWAVTLSEGLESLRVTPRK